MSEIWQGRALIREALKESGMRPGELARKLGVSPQYVSALLHRNENLTLRQFMRVLDAMGYELTLVPEKRKTNRGA